MGLTRIKLERFTAFTELDLEFSPGVNVLVGENGTGKTHLMKVCYAACDVSRSQTPFEEKLRRVFLPSGSSLWRLKRRSGLRDRASIEVFRDELSLHTSFSVRAQTTGSRKKWVDSPIESTYIPVKEMLSNAPGFQSLYAERQIHFEEVYNDILNRAYRPLLRQKLDVERQGLLSCLEDKIGGKVRARNQEFFLHGRSKYAYSLEFTLLAEGIRKLGLLWLLIRNGSLPSGSVLFWDEPETNLNPSMFGVVVDILLRLQQLGVQVFLATHSYALLKELDLRQEDTDEVAFHAFYHTEEGELACNTTDGYSGIHPNAIKQAFDSLYDRQIERSIRGIM